MSADAPLLGPLFHGADAQRIFSPKNQLSQMIRFEVALGHALEATGATPSGTGDACERGAQGFQTAARIEAIANEAVSCGNIAIPFVKRLTDFVREREGHAADFIHFGATSQDLLDTALVLQLREFITWTTTQLLATCVTLSRFADEHRATLMPGRTWLQQGPPITFGLKAAQWLSAVLRHLQRFTVTRDRVCVLQFGGAVGTLASLGSSGAAVSQEMGKMLALPVPDIPWHSQRDSLAELASVLGLITGTLGKIARDLSLMLQNEVAEVQIASPDGSGGSSTMPHKRNPVSLAVVLAAAVRAPGLVSTMLSAMVQEHERGLGGWHAEWETLPELCRLTSGSLSNMNAALDHLQINVESMRANLALARGVTLAESVSMELGKAIGRPAAHRILETASRTALESHTDLLSVLREDIRVTDHLSPSNLQKSLDPASYVGSTNLFIDQVLARARQVAPKEVVDAFADVRGFKLHYRLEGDAYRPVVVLSNSLGADLSMWDAQMEALLPFFRVLRYDTRGHGKSGIPEGSCTIGDLGQDIVALLDTLGLQKSVHLCGVSLGGLTAMWVGLHVPQRISSLLLSNTAAKIGTASVWNERISTVEKDGLASIVDGVIGRWFTPTFREKTSAFAAQKAMLLGCSSAGYLAASAALRDCDLRPDIHAITAPTLIISGASDIVTPSSDGRSLEAAIPRSIFREVPGAHLPNIEEPAVYNDVLLSFLQQHGASEGPQ